MAGASSTTSSTAARAGELRVLAVVHEKESGEDREVAKLTAVATELTARSETSRSKRGSGGDLGEPRKKKASFLSCLLDPFATKAHCRPDLAHMQSSTRTGPLTNGEVRSIGA